MATNRQTTPSSSPVTMVECYADDLKRIRLIKGGENIMNREIVHEALDALVQKKARRAKAQHA